ncbi:MAG: hypothetical protein JSV58_02815 [Candidatus Bathyarchaeota archaeon]|nr:MAG: hypothetical protein JSV58_02815 [Candidatus Bathyarchaeota archaeon]
MLIAGVVIMSVLWLFPPTEIVYLIEVDETTRTSYFSDSIDTSTEVSLSKFLFDFDISTTGNSTLYVRRIEARGVRIELFHANAQTAFSEQVPVTVGHRFEIEIENDDKGYYNPLQGWIDPIQINITGSFALRRKPLYSDVLMSFGAIVLACGLLTYMRTEYKARARVEK